jgi:hypothetical protein
MAENSVPFITYKQSVRSDNDKADLITVKLQRHAILLEVVSRHPEILEEYRQAVKGGANHPAPEEPTAEEGFGRIVLRNRHL